MKTGSVIQIIPISMVRSPAQYSGSIVDKINKLNIFEEKVVEVSWDDDMMHEIRNFYIKTADGKIKNVVLENTIYTIDDLVAVLAKDLPYMDRKMRGL